MTLTPLRLAGLLAGLLLVAFAVARRRRLRRADALLVAGVGIGLLAVSATSLTDAVLEAFDFRRGDGGRILGLAVFGVAALFLLQVRSIGERARLERQLNLTVEGVACDAFRRDHGEDALRGRVVALVPAYEEADNLPDVIDRMPPAVQGVPVVTVVVDDGSRDATASVAAGHGALVARHVVNRGGGAALRTGYRLACEGRARVVVTLDADGQHRPEEIERLVGPILDGRVDVVHGSRILGDADPGHRARELGIAFFNRLVSLITRTRVTDCSNGYRAVRASVLPRLVLRQEQFHTSEFVIEAIKRGIPAMEVPVTVLRRRHGESKKPATLRYGWGFANAIVRAWLR